MEQVDGFLQHENDKLKEHDQALGSLKDRCTLAADNLLSHLRGVMVQCNLDTQSAGACPTAESSASLHC